MVATTNKGLEKPARGSLSGVWDTPVNANMDIIDSSFGGVTNIALLATTINLTGAQAQSAIIHLTGAITNHCGIGFPAIGGVWTIINDCSNNQSFTPYAYSLAGGRYCGIMPGISQIMSDGSNMRRVGLPPVGSYLQVASNSYPVWNEVASVRAYLNCDGTAFDTGTYYKLYYFLNGGTTLPDLRGRCFFSSDASTNRITSVITGSQYGASGGNQFLHGHAHNVAGGTAGNVAAGYDLTHSHEILIHQDGNAFSPGGFEAPRRSATFPIQDFTGNSGSLDHAHNLNINSNTIGSGDQQNLPPLFVGGLTLIRTGE